MTFVHLVNDLSCGPVLTPDFHWLAYWKAHCPSRPEAAMAWNCRYQSWEAVGRLGGRVRSPMPSHDATAPPMSNHTSLNTNLRPKMREKGLVNGGNA